MDITKITDTKELKALAYEQILLIEQSQGNLRLLQERIVELEKPKEDKDA